jgi:mannose-6-phosphate isomerase-like protein (cupin superfamily)
MKYALTPAALLAMTLLAAAAGVPSAVHYIGQEKVSATMAKGGPIINDNGLIVLAQRRGIGQAEVHENTNHVFIMVDGEAAFVTGGKLVDARKTAPGQIRGAGIEGGQTHRLAKGDVITIPAGTPHWWKEVTTGTVGYYAVNIEP